jgi:hypothetical protein
MSSRGRRHAGAVQLAARRCGGGAAWPASRLWRPRASVGVRDPLKECGGAPTRGRTARSETAAVTLVSGTRGRFPRARGRPSSAKRSLRRLAPVPLPRPAAPAAGGPAQQQTPPALPTRTARLEAQELAGVTKAALNQGRALGPLPPTPPHAAAERQQVTLGPWRGGRGGEKERGRKQRWGGQAPAQTAMGQRALVRGGSWETGCTARGKGGGAHAGANPGRR